MALFLLQNPSLMQNRMMLARLPSPSKASSESLLCTTITTDVVKISHLDSLMWSCPSSSNYCHCHIPSPMPLSPELSAFITQMLSSPLNHTFLSLSLHCQHCRCHSPLLLPTLPLIDARLCQREHPTIVFTHHHHCW